MELRGGMEAVSAVTAALGTWHLAFSQGDVMKDFRDLKVWDRAHRPTLRVYKVSAHFPREELFGLISQMRRCSASIGANIAEGCGKRGNNEFQHFLQIASGSGRIGIPPFARP
jgi:23S rRNA-intervening sequence protein